MYDFSFITCWLIFDVSHDKQMHGVYRLKLHLPLEQSVYFHGNVDNQALKQALNQNSNVIRQA